MIAPQSMEMMSPSLRTTSSDGMPWTTTSFTEVQIVAGKPPYPRKFGFASCSASTLRATWSRSLVEAPGTAASRVAAWMAATTSPAARILAICSGDLICTMAAKAFRGPGRVRTPSTIRLRGRRAGGRARRTRSSRGPLRQGTAAEVLRRLLAVLAPLQRLHGASGHILHLAERRDRHHEALGLVVVDDRLGLRVVDLQPGADGLLGVVVPLVELAAADVA